MVHPAVGVGHLAVEVGHPSRRDVLDAVGRAGQRPGDGGHRVGVLAEIDHRGHDIRKGVEPTHRPRRLCQRTHRRTVARPAVRRRPRGCEQGSVHGTDVVGQHLHDLVDRGECVATLQRHADELVLHRHRPLAQRVGMRDLRHLHRRVDGGRSARSREVHRAGRGAHQRAVARGAVAVARGHHRVRRVGRGQVRIEHLAREVADVLRARAPGSEPGELVVAVDADVGQQALADDHAHLGVVGELPGVPDAVAHHLTDAAVHGFREPRRVLAGLAELERRTQRVADRRPDDAADCALPAERGLQESGHRSPILGPRQ